MSAIKDNQLLIKLGLTLILILSACFQTAIARDAECQNIYQGETLSESELKNILEAHEAWLQTDGQSSEGQAQLCQIELQNSDLSNRLLSKANFYGANLTGINLSHSDLEAANFFKAYLPRANLEGAYLQHANMAETNLFKANLNNADLRRAVLVKASLREASLKGADLFFTKFNGAALSDADLRGANLQWTDLSHADLTGADLTGADLSHANLTSARLENAKIEGAVFTNAILKGAFFQPQLRALPDVATFHTINFLEEIKFVDLNSGKAALNELKVAYKNLGVRSMERRLTAIIKYKEMVAAWEEGKYLESAFNYVLFYLTSNYGANPGRPLMIFFLGVFVFALPYRVALSKGEKHSGIMIIWEPGRFYHWDKVKQLPDSPIRNSKLLTTHAVHGGIIKKIKCQLRMCQIAFFFSLMMAFSIGWKEINVGNWVNHLQPREYTLKGKGWVRMLAGIQSVLSAYLLVLWLLTYFGRPFEW